MSVSTEQLLAFVRKNPAGCAGGVVIVIAAVVLYFGSGLLPEAEQDLNEKSQLGLRLQSNLKNANQLKEQLEALVAAEKNIEGRLIRSSELMINNQYFYKLESETDVKLVDMKQTSTGVLKPGAGKNYIPITFTVNAQGTYKQILNFLRHLEGGTHFCRIISATCSPVGERSGRMTAALTLELLGRP